MRKIQRQNNPILILVFLSWLFFGFQTLFSGIVQPFFLFAIAIIFLIISFFSSIFYISFFIIPLENPIEIVSLVSRVIRFFFKSHGSIYLIKNGQLKTVHAGFTTNQPGLALLDSSSAAIISRTTSYHRTIGPGVCFLEKNETVSHTISLAWQRKWIGPLENEDPFKAQARGETDKEFQSRIKRSDDTTALTSDGKKIIASFLIIYKLKAVLNVGGSPYGYDPLSVGKALLRISSSNSESSQVEGHDWTDLPGILVADVWKKEVIKYSFQEIMATNETVIDNCINSIMLKMTGNSSTENYDDNSFGRFQRPNTLTDRGLEIKNIFLMRIFPESNVQLK